MTRHPVLRPGDLLRLGGATHTVAGLDSVTVRLADVTGAVIEVPTAGLLADPSLELVTASRVPMARRPALERLPAGTVEAARWWERHLIEVITGVPPGSPPGTGPRPEYDPARQSLRQRELAKHGELTRAGHRVGLSTLKRLRARYERDGLWGVTDRRAARRTAPAGYVDPRVVAATRQAIEQETDRSTGTVGRLRRRVEQILAETTEAGERPQMPPERTFYRLAGRLASGRHTFGSARTRRSLANQPDGPFGAVTAARPGEWTQIDSTPLDVRVVHDDGTVDRVELTGLVDQATRTIAAAVLRPTTKAVDAALLLARALTPEPMRPGWTDALRLTRSVLPHQGLTAIDERLAAAAARPVIVPETIVCDHGKAYLSATFRAACRSLGISLAPAHPHTRPTSRSSSAPWARSRHCSPRPSAAATGSGPARPHAPTPASSTSASSPRSSRRSAATTLSCTTTPGRTSTPPSATPPAPSTRHYATAPGSRASGSASASSPPAPGIRPWPMCSAPGRAGKTTVLATPPLRSRSTLTSYGSPRAASGRTAGRRRRARELD